MSKSTDPVESPWKPSYRRLLLSPLLQLTHLDRSRPLSQLRSRCSPCTVGSDSQPAMKLVDRNRERLIYSFNGRPEDSLCCNPALMAGARVRFLQASKIWGPQRQEQAVRKSNRSYARENKNVHARRHQSVHEGCERRKDTWLALPSAPHFFTFECAPLPRKVLASVEH